MDIAHRYPLSTIGVDVCRVGSRYLQARVGISREIGTYRVELGIIDQTHR